MELGELSSNIKIKEKERINLGNAVKRSEAAITATRRDFDSCIKSSKREMLEKESLRGDSPSETAPVLDAAGETGDSPSLEVNPVTP